MLAHVSDKHTNESFFLFKLEVSSKTLLKQVQIFNNVHKIFIEQEAHRILMLTLSSVFPTLP